MFPRQLDELARQRTQLIRSQAQPAASSAHGHRRLHALRKQTGWSLVEVGLRIAESAGR